MTRHVIVVGKRNESDFQQVLSWLTSRSHLSFADSSNDACQRAAENPAPELIVLLQSRPGQFPSTGVEHLHRTWPLARIVMILGSWCEGESRSGKPCLGTWRIYWYDFIRRMSPVFESALATAPESWCLPRSANETERLLWDLSEAPTPRQGLAAIVADTRDAYESLADACRTMSLDAVWHRFNGSLPATISVGIWDARRGDQDEWTEIREFGRAIHPVRVLVAQGFPRIGEIERAAFDGVMVLAKPFQLPDLWRALNTTATIGSV